MKYETGDIATYYFIIMDKDNKSSIVGWTDDKDLAKAYLDFHNCKCFKMKKYVATIEEIYKMLEENINDEIRMINIAIRNTKKNRKDDVEFITIPATELQNINLKDETMNFLYTSINYSYINNAIPYLKNKYQEALEDIYLIKLINAVLNNRPSKFSTKLMFDELVLLTRIFPDQFD